MKFTDEIALREYLTENVANYVYCPQCEKVVEYLRETLPATGLKPHIAADIMCRECANVIATFYAKEQGTVYNKPEDRNPNFVTSVDVKPNATR